MNWLITGGCGFIGKNLIKRLVLEKEAHSIRVVDNFSVGSLSDLSFATNSFIEAGIGSANWNNPKEIDVVFGDIKDEDLAIKVGKGADIIVHLAANTGVGPSVIDPRQDCLDNVLGTFNYLESARQNSIKRFIFASSGAPIGDCTPPIHEELPCHPISPYGASKLAGEGYCSAYYSSFNINTIALRFGNVYGPGSSLKESVVAKFIKRALNGDHLEIFGDGNQTRDFIYVEDLVNAIILSSKTTNIGGEIFQIATNTETTILELTKKLVQIIHETTGKQIDIKHTPKRIGDVIRNFSDTSKAELQLNWKSSFPLAKGLRLTLDSFISEINEN